MVESIRRHANRGRQPDGRISRRTDSRVGGSCPRSRDSFADMIYVLLPVWQVQLALGYVALALLRAIYVAAPALLQALC